MIKSTLLKKLIEDNLKVLEMNLKDDSWRDTVPSSPGWYFIGTNTPPSVFKSVGPPRGKNHCNIHEKVNASLSLKDFGVCILPSSDNPFYFVYSGEAKNLKTRALEHVSGHSETFCLAIENYPVLHKYDWRFHFALCHFGKDPNESKLLRIFGEQLWRSKYGWPILCSR